MGNKRIKLYSPVVTQTSSIIEETLYSAITRNRFQKRRTKKTIVEKCRWIDLKCRSHGVLFFRKKITTLLF
jgi:hypothetical protein